MCNNSVNSKRTNENAQCNSDQHCFSLISTVCSSNKCRFMRPGFASLLRRLPEWRRHDWMEVRRRAPATGADSKMAVAVMDAQWRGVVWHTPYFKQLNVKYEFKIRGMSVAFHNAAPERRRWQARRAQLRWQRMDRNRLKWKRRNEWNGIKWAVRDARYWMLVTGCRIHDAGYLLMDEVCFLVNEWMLLRTWCNGMRDERLNF